MPGHKLKLSPLPTYPDEPRQELSLVTDAAANQYAHDRYFPPEMKDYAAVFVSGSDLLIPTSVNASTPKLFLIDTGAVDNALSLATAQQVTKVRTVANKSAYPAEDVVVQFANFKQERSDMFAYDLSKISKGAGMEISGLLGIRMLSEMEMKIDYRDGLVSFWAGDRYRVNAVDQFDARFDWNGYSGPGLRRN
jgi:hypothetical protein